MNFQEYYSKDLLNENSYSRLMSAMSGLIPKIREFGILTWENPGDVKYSSEENNKRNTELRDELKKANYGFIQIVGKYDKIENPFFVMNISRKDLISFGLMKNPVQESVIHAVVQKPLDVLYEMIYLDGRESLFRRVWRKIDNGKPIWSHEDKTLKRIENSKDNYFSKYKGRKFIIPFFDDDMENAKFDPDKEYKGEYLNPITGVSVVESHRIYFRKDFSEDFSNEIENIFEEKDVLGKKNKIHQWAARGQIYSYLYEESVSPGKIDIKRKDIQNEI